MTKTNYYLSATLCLSLFSFEAAARSKGVWGAESAATSGQQAVRIFNLSATSGLAGYRVAVETPLNQAAAAGNVAQVKALLEAGANPNEIVQADIRITALHTAIRFGSPEMIALFIKHKADVNFRLKNGMNSLHIAALWNTDGRIAALLLAAGADPNAVTDESLTPHAIAVSKNRQAVADVLGKAMNPATRNQNAELFTAVKAKNKELALELIKQGADVNYQTGDDTVLTEAIRQRDTEMAKILLAAGANPNEVDAKKGASALRMAVQMSNAELVELLISKYKADVNPKSESGYSILHAAADFNASKDITALLLAAGSDPNVVNNNGLAPYEYALSMQKTDIAKLLAMVTDKEKIAAVKKAKGITAKPVETASTVPAASADDDAKDEMDDIAANIVIKYKKQKFELYDEGFAATQGRNSNAIGDVKKQSIFQGRLYQLVMISKDAIAVNAVMNGTLLKVPCDDCRTSISTYTTSTDTYQLDGYRVITLNIALTDSQNNFVEYILKSNSPGSPAKWLLFSKSF